MGFADGAGRGRHGYREGTPQGRPPQHTTFPSPVLTADLKLGSFRNTPGKKTSCSPGAQQKEREAKNSPGWRSCQRAAGTAPNQRERRVKKQRSGVSTFRTDYLGSPPHGSPLKAFPSSPDPPTRLHKRGSRSSPTRSSTRGRGTEIPSKTTAIKEAAGLPKSCSPRGSPQGLRLSPGCTAAHRPVPPRPVPRPLSPQRAARAPPRANFALPPRGAPPAAPGAAARRKSARTEPLQRRGSPRSRSPHPGTAAAPRALTRSRVRLRERRAARGDRRQLPRSAARGAEARAALRSPQRTWQLPPSLPPSFPGRAAPRRRLLPAPLWRNAGRPLPHARGRCPPPGGDAALRREAERAAGTARGRAWVAALRGAPRCPSSCQTGAVRGAGGGNERGSSACGVERKTPLRPRWCCVYWLIRGEEAKM